jgi:hypothetical protein
MCWIGFVLEKGQGTAPGANQNLIKSGEVTTW